MKVISINEYNSNMGTLIDIEDKNTYNIKHIEGAINIPYLELSYRFNELLDKNKTYYIYCHGGHKSKRIVSILEAYGYNVVQVLI